MSELLTEQESIDRLRKIVTKGQDFGCSVIQRHLRIGYCRSFRIMELAVETGQAHWHTDTRIVFKESP